MFVPSLHKKISHCIYCVSPFHFFCFCLYFHSQATLLLNDNMMKGHLPVEIGLLKQLGKLTGQRCFTKTVNLVLRDPFPNEDSFFLFVVYTENLTAHDNHFDGEIPQSLSQLTTINSLTLYNNRMHGNVPVKLCDLKQGLFHQPILKFLAADCLEKVHCKCCDKCY